MPSAEKGLLIVLTAPSGTGKGTVIERVRREEPNISYSVSATTRPMRPGDEEGVTYFFVGEERFAEMIERGELLEYAGLYGRRYGTPRAYVEKLRSEGRDVLLEIDSQGGVELLKRGEDIVPIFVLPPSMAELKRRLTDRGTESMEEVERRLAFAYKELPNALKYRYCLINEDVERAARGVQTILEAERGQDGPVSMIALERFASANYKEHIERLMEEVI